MQEFEIRLKNEKAGLYKLFAWLLVLLNLLYFVLIAYYTDKGAGIGGIISYILCLVIMKAMKRTSFEISKILLLISVLIWIIAGYYGFAILSLFLFFLYTISIRNKVVIFNESAIVYPTFPPKNIYWNELHQAMVKDGLLTIDLRNNRLIQQLVDESKTTVNEKEFNEFCSRQLNK